MEEKVIQTVDFLLYRVKSLQQAGAMTRQQSKLFPDFSLFLKTLYFFNQKRPATGILQIAQKQQLLIFRMFHFGKPPSLFPRLLPGHTVRQELHNSKYFLYITINA